MKKRWVKVIAIILAVLLVLAVLTGGFLWGKLGKVDYAPVNRPQEQEQQKPEKNPEKKPEEHKEVLNVLLMGTDERSDEFSDNARSDSMILASVNKKTKEIRLVSLERGMGVPVLEGPYQGEVDWLTHIFRYGGAPLLLRTVRECFQVEVDRFVRVNFHSVVHLVDAVGGVDVELSDKEAEYMRLSAGAHHLDGTQALQYARMRAPDSDWRRVERQRRVIIQCMQQVKDLSIGEINRLADEMLPLVQTNFTKGEMAGLLLQAPGFLHARVEQMTLPAQGTFGSKEGMDGRIVFDVDFEANSAILHNFLYSVET